MKRHERLRARLGALHAYGRITSWSEDRSDHGVLWIIRTDDVSGYSTVSTRSAELIVDRLEGARHEQLSLL